MHLPSIIDDDRRRTTTAARWIPFEERNDDRFMSRGEIKIAAPPTLHRPGIGRHEMAFNFLPMTMPPFTIEVSLQCNPQYSILCFVRRVPFPVMSCHVVGDLFSCLKLFISIKGVLVNASEYQSNHYHPQVADRQSTTYQTMMEEQL